ncbi:hypothetical protein [Caulobacter mirabilis]|uniref:Uncharacterized protein n=1 Tax=Caulobacter mirabilis TaxID=69666 RepID=A0A2D2AT32_9CAUL|nr:hypothetical protein [Caulobacter mirabilis]ATQ41164.1 hypothetical protein CSW64_01425 [Caulobacter mirabilis]
MSLAPAAFILVALVGPPLWALYGLWRSRSTPPPTAPAAAWDWRLTIASTLLFALAFNLTFFVQELFLVWPKALTPGLHPVLFHNNHDWTGDNPLAELLQGTGALAILILGGLCALLLDRRPPRSMSARLFLFWMAFQGLFMSLPQAVVGAYEPRNDVGRATTHLGFTPEAKTAAALIALAAIVALASWLGPRLLGLAAQPSWIDTPRRRMLFALRTAGLPALLGALLVIPFRVPGHVIEAAIVPIAVAIIGSGWILADAWRAAPTDAPAPSPARATLGPPLIALAAVLAVFQIVLRPGITFG